MNALKKALFYIFLLLSAGLLINILGIIVMDMDRLTRYGWGYLTGRIILLALFIALSYYMFTKTYGEKQE
jgi:hypothetical protein